MTFSVARSNSAFTSTLEPLIREGILAMFRHNLNAPNDIHPIGPNDFAVYAVDEEDNVIGVLTYGYTNRRDTLTVTFAYVDPAHRRTGIVSEMLAEAYEHCQSLNIGYITLSVPAASKELIASIEALDFTVSKYVYTRKVD